MDALPGRNALLDAVFPWNNACILCRCSLLDGEMLLCRHCEAELAACRLTSPEMMDALEPMHLCISALTYEDAAQLLVYQLKYRCDPAAAWPLAQHMCAALLKSGVASEIDAVVPVPLHPNRMKQRGYNQAHLLAQEVCRCFGLRLLPQALTRVKETRSQTTRSAEERRAAMEGAFTAAPEVTGLRLLLVDDVLTTGATAAACANALLDAGALQVTLLTACHA